MSEEFKGIVDSSYDHGTPLWVITADYIYGMVPTEGDKWKEVSYTFEDPDEPLRTGEKGADFAYQLMMKELSMGLTFYVEDFKAPEIKQFGESAGGSGAEKIKAVISELINNTGNYSSNSDFLVKSKDELGKLKGKL